MKKFFVLVTVLTLAFQLSYAKTCYSTGFESSSETQGWNFVNGSQTKKWMIGMGTGHNGSRSL